MANLLEYVLDFCFPTKCVLCRKMISPPGRPRICAACQEELPMGQKLVRRVDFTSGCVSALSYEGALRDAIIRYKFGGRQSYATAFGLLVAELVQRELEGRYDLIAWPPLARDRLRERGYDQTELMVKVVSKSLHMPYARLLRKRRGVARQSSTQSRDARRANISGAYRVVRPELVEGRRILLIDDILTTGATLSECAKTLLYAGAEGVVGATLAVRNI